MSYGDAQPLLAALKGPSLPKPGAARCPSPITSGPGPRRFTCDVEFNWDTQAPLRRHRRIPGSEFPDEWVIRGNHHDAWVNGADDPLSGAVAELEEARALGELAEARLETEAHHHLLLLGRRRAGAARFHRMGRNARRRSREARRRLHQLRRQRPRIFERAKARTRSKIS